MSVVIQTFLYFSTTTYFLSLLKHRIVYKATDITDQVSGVSGFFTAVDHENIQSSRLRVDARSERWGLD